MEMILQEPVFRRHHVQNDPVNLVDLLGLEGESCPLPRPSFPYQVCDKTGCGNSLLQVQDPTLIKSEKSEPWTIKAGISGGVGGAGGTTGLEFTSGGSIYGYFGGGYGYGLNASVTVMPGEPSEGTSFVTTATAGYVINGSSSVIVNDNGISSNISTGFGTGGGIAFTAGFVGTARLH